MIDETRQSSLGSIPSGGGDKRRHSRVDFSTPVLVRVLIEEETFEPMRLGGRTRNVSLNGMLLQIEGLTEAEYNTLIRRQRMIRVHTKFPGNDEELVYFGKIVCYDFHRGENEQVSCLLGMGFEELPEREEKALTALLERLLAAGA